MKITLTIEQLQDLLNQQKTQCKFEFEGLWRNSDIRKELMLLDPEEKILNSMHEVRDKIVLAEFPDDFKVLLKYNVQD
ncbi:hypothetical protein HHL23_09570 [Chryseobacterium sp. RP-3-3]|uniref:Uncharacterized protein n=1 Tax=Chryseobacterium antibioticum TaxID=2728847 RepID=A0A7Y0FS36_9FLAO|nr:hypothetical protein [Chryseobacterium antibioticum]NML70049.1 hypothetical protein [Chryseobacterium antibioticum]